MEVARDSGILGRCNVLLMGHEKGKQNLTESMKPTRWDQDACRSSTAIYMNFLGAQKMCPQFPNRNT